MSRGRRYAVRVLVVLAICGVLVGVMYLWRSTSLSSLVTDGRGGDRRPPGGGTFDRDRRRPGDGAAFSLSNVQDLVQTIAIGVGVLATVVVFDRVRRASRPRLQRPS